MTVSWLKKGFDGKYYTVLFVGLPRPLKIQPVTSVELKGVLKSRVKPCLLSGHTTPPHLKRLELQ